jgi:mRNA-degrading endonuclease HigB of HigAB toxin-antitoxin module
MPWHMSRNPGRWGAVPAGKVGRGPIDHRRRKASPGDPGRFEIVAHRLTGPCRRKSPLPKDGLQQRQPNISLAGKLLGWKHRVAPKDGLMSAVTYFERLLLRAQLAKETGGLSDVSQRRAKRCAEFRSFSFSSTSRSALEDGRAVFNIAGNKYRIVVWINYPHRVIYLRFIGTHRQYDAIEI